MNFCFGTESNFKQNSVCKTINSICVLNIYKDANPYNRPPT